MSLLEKLWDDTVAGPRPDYGLGKLLKFNTFNFRSTSGKDMEEAGNNIANQEAKKVTRSIMIVKSPGQNTAAGSAPVSPAGSISPRTPTSPFSDQGPSDFEGAAQRPRLRRQRTKMEPEALLLLKMSDI